ncbi:mannose-6-phosphate isomerase [Gluconobacter cerinus NRIC 0229]|nr:AGE family epimerase/isomerase [Gluconobacter cerinus]GBQ95024.1 mannose-6-phosphate isomerase [Gluconobacter cerinus NRIC 0229]
MLDFNHAHGIYHERLSFEGMPVAVPELRLMVQARQIATFCRASMDGTYEASAAALMCLDRIEKLYHRADGAPGWVFSITPDLAVKDGKRDLYAHAFILYAYAWAYKVMPSTRYLNIVRATIAEMHQIFSAPHGGFFNVNSPLSERLYQNPHMHLLEAFLALYEVSGLECFLEEADALITLSLERMIQSETGVLLEEFDRKWERIAPIGKNRVEPGHLFEWFWLFSEYSRLNSGSKRHITIKQASDRLFDLGLACGVSNGFVRDAIHDDGTQSENSIRIWPQTELCRVLLQRRTEPDLLNRVSRNFFACFAPNHLQGLWIDRFSEAGQPRVNDVPASSLYHIYGAAREFHVAKITGVSEMDVLLI